MTFSLLPDNDTLLFIDFRADRMRQIVEALGIKPQFDIDSTPNNLSVFSMTEYKKEFPFPVVFPPVIPNNTLAEWLSSKALPQFHCAGMYNVHVCREMTTFTIK